MSDVLPQPAQPTTPTPGLDPAFQQFARLNQQQTAAEQAHQQQKQAAMNPLYDAAQRTLQTPQPIAPPPVPLPQADKQSVVDAKQFQQFSLGMMGLALIGGGLSKSHWMRATASLDGAMKGYLAGSMELADERKQKFDQDFKLAVQKEKQQNDEYIAALNQRNTTIKDIMAQAEVVAAKYGMVDAQDAITRRDINSMFQVYIQRSNALDRLQLQHDQLQQGIRQKQISRLDSLLKNGQIDADTHDAQVNAIENGETPPPMKTQGGMNPQDLSIAVQDYFQNGHMTSLGMNNPVVRAQILKGASDIGQRLGLSPSDVVTGWATHKADMGALAQIDKQQAAVGNFEETAQKNLALMNQYALQVPRTSYSQMLNTWLQKGRVQSGDPQADAFNASMETFVSEYAKVMGGGYGAGQTTEGAQARAHSILSTADTPDQLKAKTDLMVKEMNNRMTSLDEARQKLIDRIKGGSSGSGNVMKFDAQGNPVQ